MTTELSLCKEFVICSADELRDEKNQNGRDYVVLLLWRKASSLDLSVSERSPAIAGSAYSTLGKIKAWKIICRESEGSPWALSWESR